MKNLGVTIIMAIAFVGLTAMSCKDAQKEDSSATMDSEVNQEQESTSKSDAQNPESQQVLADYMMLKDALVATDEKAAADAGKKLESALKSIKLDNYTSEQQKELKEIVESATEHAEHIGKSEIDHQREHFQMLTKDVTDMVAITGTNNTLYQQFCPMYAVEGGAWLSMEKEIKNPYFGSKMMKCGKVQKEIN